MPDDEHVVKYARSYPGLFGSRLWVGKCSCGWRTAPWATLEGAESEGRVHRQPGAVSIETVVDIDGTIRKARRLSDALWRFGGYRVRIRIEVV